MKRFWLGFFGLLSIAIVDCSPPSKPEFSGPELVRRLGCLACHGLGDSVPQGASWLDGKGSKLTRQELEVSLTHPRRRHPGAKMPSYAYVRQGELEALVRYLESLK
ncbi:MAG: cytochrome c [Deltaproteobacteria bacterium]|nr:cytochrome c [Deltaproteobacteria bacterium]